MSNYALCISSKLHLLTFPWSPWTRSFVKLSSHFCTRPLGPLAVALSLSARTFLPHPPESRCERISLFVCRRPIHMHCLALHYSTRPALSKQQKGETTPKRSAIGYKRCACPVPFGNSSDGCICSSSRAPFLDLLFPTIVLASRSNRPFILLALNSDKLEEEMRGGKGKCSRASRARSTCCSSLPRFDVGPRSSKSAAALAFY